MYSKIATLYVILFAIIFSPAQAEDFGYKPGELIVRFALKANGTQRSKDERNSILASINGGHVKHSL